jgi:hypothetical protein
MLDTESISTRPHMRASGDALKYLISSSANAISITCDVDGAVITVGSKIDPEAVAIFWLPKGKARSVAAKARAIAGSNPDLDQAVAALQEAAAKGRVTLTAHEVVVERAGKASRKLRQRTSALKGSPALRAFNLEYAKRRQVAAACGRGFMSYNNALRRLQEALIPSLMNGGKLVADQSLFAQVFNAE